MNLRFIYYYSWWFFIVDMR